MIVELYPKAEENPAVSRVFFRKTVIFRDPGPSRPGPPPAPAAAASAMYRLPERLTIGRQAA
jgi:hypothetical protein